MIVKPCKEPLEFSIWRSLRSRKQNITKEDMQYYFQNLKGFHGELEFEKWCEDLPEDWLCFHNLCLEVKNSKFQLDYIVLTNKSLFLFEIKFYSHDYYFENDTLYTHQNKEVLNPSLQLQRNKTLLRQFLTEHDYNIPIHAYVIFINPHFFLYYAPLDEPYLHSFVYPPQLKRFKKKLHEIYFNTQVILSYQKLQDLSNLFLKQSFVPKNLMRIPGFDFEELKKGIRCKNCSSLQTKIKTKLISCEKCGISEKKKEAVLRNIEEFILLFPSQKLTTTKIYQWCKILSQKTIYQILRSNFKPTKKTRYTYYQ
ncbi:hypothetical protein BTS2_1945 [Bacillus sp. TS-2]|nr:hypothetical protein BTS2_1945 [Bacillus sp. TS-2]